MQVVFIMLCSLCILWAFEMRYKESIEKLSKAVDDIETLKDELSSTNKQLKVVSQRLNDIGISTS
ncbi:MAG: hypothetical protein ISS45_08220 [Candidatus Omnitrophica bacterium]|nr:hypothetical protein [Candidatus Omnitrophota bacterium]